MEEISENELRREFYKDWRPEKWYTVSQIASKLNSDRRTVMRWNNPGLRRKDGGFIVLKMMKIAEKSSRGKWIIDFLIERNLRGY